MIPLPIAPQEATKQLLKKLSSRRMRDVLEKRFALKGGAKKTLEAVGREYKITRERVRQIEAEALKQVARPENLADAAPLYEAIEAHLKNHGGVMGERHLLVSLADTRHHAHLKLLLDVHKGFHLIPEDDLYQARWTTQKVAAEILERSLASVVSDFETGKRLMSRDELIDLVRTHVHEHAGVMPNDSHCDAVVNISKLIRKNPYDEYGLVGWPAINPSGVKDKAYAVFSRVAKPMHFRDVAVAIDQAGWTKKKAHPQTVHNELIKDARFVLVGRGLYALREWGYEPGMVRDVIVSVLREAKRALSVGDIIRAVLAKRLVKAPTILLNLQNKKYFKRTGEDIYALV